MEAVPSPGRDYPWAGFLVVAAAIVLAAATARPYAGGWNDGSRLATVEALVDHHTLAIDDSIFVRIPPADAPSRRTRRTTHSCGRAPSTSCSSSGHYYSDKSPVPALLLAGVYEAWQAATGLTARERPDLFCLVMTLASSGLAYVVAVWCVYQIGGAVGLGETARLALTATFGLATVALPYAAHVNNHALLLGVTAALMLGFVRLAEARAAGRVPWGWLAALGTLTGLGYSIDLGVGPVLVMCAGALVVFRCRRLAPVAVFALAALPWLVLHHAVNYAVGGTLLPANAVAAYFDWPGCSVQRGQPDRRLEARQRSAISCSTPRRCWRASRASSATTRRCSCCCRGCGICCGAPELPEVLFAYCLCGGVWLAYAVNSNNASGQCLSIRWFVPLLAPAYYLLAVGLKRCPRALRDLLLLGLGGAALTALGCWYGPWIHHLLPGFWPVQAAALLGLRRVSAARATDRAAPAATAGAARPLARAA